MTHRRRRRRNIQMATSGSHVVRFGAFELDGKSGELRRRGLKVRLPDQSFQILKLLLSRPGEVVSRDDLRRALWTSDTFVDFEVGLNSAVRKLREALDDSADNPRFVETVPRRGYRFVASVFHEPESVPVAEPVTVPTPSPETFAPSRSRGRQWSLAVLLLLVLAGLASAPYLRRHDAAREAYGGAAGRPLARDGGRARLKEVNPQAYEAFLKGMGERGLQRHEGFQRAVAYFEKAIAIQPDFAEAYGELALTQVQFVFGGPFSPHETMPRAEATARKALELDDMIAPAHQALGQVLALYHWKWDEGARMLEHAAKIRRDRNGAASQFPMAPLIRAGRFTEAITVAEEARRLDPQSLNALIGVGTAYQAAGNYDRALEALHHALTLSPGNVRVRYQFGATYVAMGRFDDGIRELELAVRVPHGHNSRFEAYLGYAYAAAGRIADARAILKELESHRRDQYVSSFGIALIHDALGEKAPALAALERACQDRAVEFSFLAQYPRFKTIAGEPRYQAVMRQVGLPG